VVVLREVADARFVAEAHPARIGRRGYPSTILSSVDLPRPFGPMTATFSPRRTGQRHVAQDLLGAVGLGHAVDVEHVAPARPLGTN
jgi:hypothetical protein